MITDKIDSFRHSPSVFLNAQLRHVRSHQCLDIFLRYKFYCNYFLISCIISSSQRSWSQCLKKQRVISPQDGFWSRIFHFYWRAQQPFFFFTAMDFYPLPLLFCSLSHTQSWMEYWIGKHVKTRKKNKLFLIIMCATLQQPTCTS